MLSSVILTSAWWLMCMAWFAVVQKPLFALFNRRLTARPVGWRDVVAVYSHGTVSDAVMASYLAMPVLIVATLCTLVPAIGIHGVMTGLNIILALALGLLVTADTVLYSFWKFKIDSSVFAYLHSLRGATASVSGGYLAAATGAWLAVSATFFAAVQWVTGLVIRIAPFPDTSLPWWGYMAVILTFAVAGAVLFLTTRGLGIRPRNPSVVYFSSNQFLNHWALNPGFQMIYSLTTREDFGDTFRYYPEAERAAALDGLFPVAGTPLRHLLRTDRPNVLIVIWESFGAGFSSATGGKEGVTPHFDTLAREGVIFTRCTAGSFRTDRGLVNILGGYPAQPTTSIIRHTRKLPGLPALARTLHDNGYTTMAIHGGDLSIMHKNDYYLASGHDTLVSQSDMPSSDASCKWGVHDGPMMERTLREMRRLTREGKEPWLVTLQTLSSHEPFDVPYSRLDDRVDNAFAYTDHCLGELTASLREEGLWDNLLLVVVADLSLNLPRPVTDYSDHSHIPLLLTGGAVKEHAVIDTLMSQTDIAATLLGQLGIGHEDFPFSRDVLADTYLRPFGLHIFQNGIMVSDATGHTSYDTQLDRIIEGDDDPARIRIMKSILQTIYSDLDRR